MMSRLSVFAVVLVLASCQVLSSEPEDAVRLEGSLFYHERIALPAGSRVSLRLEDAAGQSIAESSFTVDRQVPLPFELEVDRNRIPESGRVVLHARLDFANDGPRFATRHEFNLDPDGPPPDLNLRVSEGGNDDW